MITALYTSVLAIMFLVLSYNVIFLRYRYRIPVGDGGNPDMQKLLQARANFVDYVPLGLVMLLILEYEGVPDVVLHGMGGTIVLSRLLQGWGLSVSSGGSFGRVAGALLMHAVLIIGALGCLGFFILRSGVLYF